MKIIKQSFMVRFAGDNDFHRTVKRFVQAIAPIVFQDGFKTCKADIVKLFNETAYSFYTIAHYDSWNEFPTEKCGEVITTKDYLQITEKDVYFDNEVSEFTDFNHDGCMAVKINNKNGFDIQYHMV